MSRGTRRPLRVLQVIASMHIGGAENVVSTLAQRLDRQRFTVALCCTKALGVLAERLKIESPDVDVMLSSTPHSLLRYAAPLALYRKISQFRPDVVHTHGITALLHTGPLAVPRLLPPWVHTFHFGNYDNRPASRAIKAEGFLSRYPTRLIAVADSQRASIIRRHRVPAHRIATILNGVRPNPGVGVSATTQKRAEFGYAPDDIVVGSIAVLSQQKGVSFLLRAIRLLVDAGSPAKFLIVGGGTLEKDLRNEAEELGVGSRVQFTGWRDDAAELMSTLDVFVMSSLWEAMPMALLEAMAMSRAIVVTDVGDNRHIVDGGRCGLLVPPSDPAALAMSIARLVADPQLRRSLGEAARSQLHERYTLDRMVAAYEDLYATLAS